VTDDTKYSGKMIWLRECLTTYGKHPATNLPGSEAVASHRTSTEELVRHAVQLPDGNGYGRRQSDDATVVRRLAAVADHNGRPLTPKLERPSWVTERLTPAYREEPCENPPEEPAPLFTEIPLDQLDLVPAAPTLTDQQEQRVDTSVSG
jgi:hypothetical protein